MIIGVDIGGTKTLVAQFSSDGRILREKRFATNKDYSQFLLDLEEITKSFNISNMEAVCAAVPGLLDRKAGTVLALGNLDWKNKSIRSDIKRIFNTEHTYIENDSKLAGLSEVKSLKTPPKRALYLTISTGIGGALLIDGKLASEMKDMELGKSPLLFNGKLVDWEDFASGRAFYEEYGVMGDEAKDPMIWQSYAQERLGPGVAVACSYLQVDTIIFGGGLGHHAKQFADYLAPYLDERLHPIVIKPDQLLAAKHGKNAVIFGCYEYAKDRLA
jgi:predicted NBD/HSP70 family sugar kinase